MNEEVKTDEKEIEINEAAMSEAERAEARQKLKKTIVKESIEWIKCFVLAFGLAMVLRATIVQAYVIPTESMVPTIIKDDRVFGNSVIYRFRKPAPGDIIAFTPPPLAIMTAATKDDMEHPIPYLKRVIAVAGDRVQVHNGVVYRNNMPQVEPYENEKPCYEMPEEMVPPDHIFVLGDNRCNSHDSHIWGFVPVKNVRAEAFFRFWPLKRAGLLR